MNGFIDRVRARVARWVPGRWRRGTGGWSTLSLRGRLMLLVASTVAAVIGAATYFELRILEGGVERDLRATARSTALAIADELDLVGPKADAVAATGMLHELMEATPVLRAITVFDRDGDEWRVFASTSSDVDPDAVELARASAERGATWWDEVPLLPRVAVPIVQAGRPVGAVVVTVSLASLDQIRARGRLVAMTAAVLAIVAVTMAVHLLARRYIHRPIDAIRQTMERATRGDLSARATVERDDELGAIARRLNHMLAEMQDLHLALQERVKEATGELQQRNRELVESFDRMLALREALARAERLAAVGHMAANVAHQIGTPLNLISGYVQMTLEEGGLDPRVSRRLQMIQEQISALAAVVRTLLDRTRRPGSREPVDAGALVRRVSEFVRPRLEAGGIAVRVHIEEPLPPLEADRAQLELALLNVIANALDAMPQGGTLELAVSRSEQGVRIAIGDTGAGIAPELMPRIFEPWVTTKPPGRGTGLGLSITREVVTTHGGSIRADNRPQGGAVFVIDLPRAADVAAPAGR